MDERSQKIVAKYLEDMHSLIRHGLEPFGRQIDEPQMARHPEAKVLVQDAQRALQGHLSQVEARLKVLGTSPTTLVQDAAMVVAGVVAGIYNTVRSEAASKSVRDDYTFLSHSAVAWLMLLTTARSLGDHDTEELAEQGYRDCARLVMQIDRLMPGLVVAELQQDGLPAQNVADWAHTIIGTAWDRQAAAAGFSR